MNRKTKRMIRKTVPYLAVSLAAVLSIILVLIFAKTPSEQSAIENASSGAAENASADGSGASSEEDGTVSSADSLEVDKLISQYYQAKIDSDVNTLNDIVDTDSPYTAAELAEESQYISKYDDLVTYVIPGVTEDYYIVYVKYNIYFNGIETGAPALNHYIIAKNADGSFYFYDRELSGEFEQYVQQTEQSETVQKLKQQVEDELAEACEADADLKYLIDVLNGDEQVELDDESTEAESSDAEEAGEESEESSDAESGSEEETTTQAE